MSVEIGFKVYRQLRHCEHTVRTYTSKDDPQVAHVSFPLRPIQPARFMPIPVSLVSIDDLERFFPTLFKLGLLPN